MEQHCILYIIKSNAYFRQFIPLVVKIKEEIILKELQLHREIRKVTLWDQI